MCALFCMALVWWGSMQVADGRVGRFVTEEPEDADSSETTTLAPTQLYAGAAVLMDADTGRVLYGKNADTPLAMASTTKIMTCILILENGDLDDEIAVSAYAASMPKVKLYVKKGERYQVKDLLYSLMLESHNDSAVVLAEYIGKELLKGELAEKEPTEFTVEESKQAMAAFAGLMNQKAEELGCEDTWFITPNGLDATEDVDKYHHTTAKDLAKIMSYCIKASQKREDFLEITRTPNYSFYANGRNYYCTNHNAFLTMMEGALSGKTGFTNKAGYCYVGALEQEGRTFVVALLACGWPSHKSYKWSDTRELMEYGTDNYFFKSLTEGKEALIEEKLVEILVEKGRTSELGACAWVQTARNETGRGIETMLLKDGEQVNVRLHQLKKLEAPVAKGTVVGYVTYSVQGVVYRVEDVVVTDGVEEITFEWCLEEVFERFLMKKYNSF